MSEELKQWLCDHKLADLADDLQSQGVKHASDMIDLDKDDAIALAVAIGLRKKVLLWRRFMGATLGDKGIPIPEQATTPQQAGAPDEVCNGCL
jgi:hypothetical protein